MHVATWNIQRILNKYNLCPKLLSQTFKKKSLIHTHGQIILCHMATFMTFEFTFKRKIGG
jgi:hypothetical protein